MTVVPLAPRGAVPGGTTRATCTRTAPPPQFRIGAAGITLPAARRTAELLRQPGRHRPDHRQGLPGASPRSTRTSSPAAGPPARAGCCSTRDQLDQFDRSMTSPAADGRHAATGWLVRFDPAQRRARRPRDPGPGHPRMPPRRLRTPWRSPPTTPSSTRCGRPARTADRRTAPRCSPSGASCTSASTGRTCGCTGWSCVVAYVQAGPQACSADAAGRLRPLLAGRARDGRRPGRHRPVRHGPARGGALRDPGAARPPGTARAAPAACPGPPSSGRPRSRQARQSAPESAARAVAVGPAAALAAAAHRR